MATIAPADADANLIAQANPNSALAETNTGTVQVTPQGGPTSTLNPSQIQSEASNQQYLNSAQAQQTQTNNQVASLLKSIQAEEQANAPGTPISLNLNQLQAQANASAQNTVNPLYTQYMNQYLQDMNQDIAAAQTVNSQNIGTEQLGLQNTLAQNTLAQQAAASSNALTQGNINAQQQNYLVGAGNAETATQAGTAAQQGSAGLGASGLGQQKQYMNENASNLANTAQLSQYQYQRNQGNLSAQDTFAQLAQSSGYATSSEQASEAATNFNLTQYLQQASQNDQAYQTAESQEQQQALTATSQQNLASEIQKAINAGSSGKNLVASEQAYQGQLNPSLSLPSPISPTSSEYLNAAGSSV